MFGPPTNITFSCSLCLEQRASTGIDKVDKIGSNGNDIGYSKLKKTKKNEAYRKGKEQNHVRCNVHLLRNGEAGKNRRHGHNTQNT